jgi:hypothetical protein
MLSLSLADARPGDNSGGVPPQAAPGSANRWQEPVACARRRRRSPHWPADQPTLRPWFCSSSHFFSGAK